MSPSKLDSVTANLTALPDILLSELRRIATMEYSSKSERIKQTLFAIDIKKSRVSTNMSSNLL
jgi:hypothetical protein